MSNTEGFADRLAWALEETGVSNAELARRVGLHRSTVGSYLVSGVMPAIDTAQRIADALGIRLEWLATGGEEPIRAGAWVVKDRPIAEVDGLIRDWDKPTEPEAKAIEEAFQGAFQRRAPDYLELPPVVQMAFQNLLARVMHSLRQAGRATDVADPAWRGRVAVSLLIDRVERRAGRGAGYDREPPSHPAWLAAIATEMKWWEDGGLPGDFEFPVDPGNPASR